MGKNNSNIHYPGDGRPLRRVYVNGKEARDCFFADLGKGYADVYRRDAAQRFMLDKHRKRILSKRLRGKVEIEYMEE